MNLGSTDWVIIKKALEAYLPKTGECSVTRHDIEHILEELNSAGI